MKNEEKKEPTLEERVLELEETIKSMSKILFVLLLESEQQNDRMIEGFRHLRSMI